MDNSINRRKAYDQAPEYIKDIYGGEKTGELLRSTANQIGLTDNSEYKTFALTVGDVILGLHPTTNLESLLVKTLNLTNDKAQTVTSSLQEVLKQIKNPPQPIDTEKFAKKETLKQPATTAAIPNEGSSESLIISPPAEKGAGPETAEDPNRTTESKPSENTSAVKPLRTFADDVEFSRAHSYGSFRSNSQDEEDEEVHSSNQDDIMKK